MDVMRDVIITMTMNVEEVTGMTTEEGTEMMTEEGTEMTIEEETTLIEEEIMTTDEITIKNDMKTTTSIIIDATPTKNVPVKTEKINPILFLLKTTINQIPNTMIPPVNHVPAIVDLRLNLPPPPSPQRPQSHDPLPAIVATVPPPQSPLPPVVVADLHPLPLPVAPHHHPGEEN